MTAWAKKDEPAKKDDAAPHLPTQEFINMARRLDDFIRPVKDIVAFAEDLGAKEGDARKAEQRVAAAKTELEATQKQIGDAKAAAQKAVEAAREPLEKELEGLKKDIETARAESVKAQKAADQDIQKIQERLLAREEEAKKTLAQLHGEVTETKKTLAKLQQEEQAIRDRLQAALR